MKLLQNKKGEIAWQFLAAIILGLIVIVILIFFSNVIKEKVIEGIQYFMSNILGR